jgi:DNA primase
MISNIGEIQERADIVDIIGHRVALRPEHANYCGECPFHGKSRTGTSFKVYPKKRRWYCWGACKVGGNVFDFLVRYESISFLEAVELVAAEAGVSVQYTPGSATERDRPQRQSLFAACAAAAIHYANELQANPAALEYARSRGLSEEIVDAWQIGYARGNSVSACADQDKLVAAGILRSPRPESQNRDPYDPLHGRLVIPLRDPVGHIVGFTGRSLPGADSAARYLNTADTQIFQKGELLFGFYSTRSAGCDTSVGRVVVEGQLKAIACQVAGIPAVAPGGATLTRRQALLLARGKSPVLLAYDNDAAGHKATATAIRELQALQYPVSVGILEIPANAPEGVRDPDDLLAAGLPIGYREVDWLAWSLDTLCPAEVNTALWARQISAEVLPLVAAHPNPLVRHVDIKRLAQLTQLPVADLAAGCVSPVAAPKTRTREAEPAPVDPKMTSGRVLCAAALQASLLPTANWWQNCVSFADLPWVLVQSLVCIAAVRRRAESLQIPVSSAIGQHPGLSPQHAAQFAHWAAVPLPVEPDPAAFAKIAGRVAAAEHLNRLRQEI